MSEPAPLDTVVLVDNTVFCNFGAVLRMDLSEVALRGRGRVTEAVREEMAASSAVLPGVDAAVGATWLDVPTRITTGRTNVQHLRSDIVDGGWWTSWPRRSGRLL